MGTQEMGFPPSDEKSTALKTGRLGLNPNSLLSAYVN